MSGIAGLPEITDRPRFDKACAGSHALPAPLLRTATPLLHSIRSGKWIAPCRRADGCRDALARQEGIRWTRRPGDPAPSTLAVIGGRSGAPAGVGACNAAARIGKAMGVPTAR